jgi:hypothetical protein
MVGFKLTRRTVRIVTAAAMVALLAGTMAFAQRNDRDRNRGGSPMFRINRQPATDLRPQVREGHMTIPAQTFFSRFGGNFERRGDEYWGRHGGHEYRFRPGDRTWYYDNDRRTSSIAPFLLGGLLYLAADDLVPAFGGRYYCNNPYDCGYADFPSSVYGGYNTGYNTPYGGTYTAPQVRIDQPQAGARINTGFVTVTGRTNTGADLRLALYRHDGGGGQLVYETGVDVGQNGYYRSRVPLFGSAQYELRVSVVDRNGRVAAQEDRWFKQY